ncbi:hypothetical protein ABK040_000010 [Willaertia magna]
MMSYRRAFPNNSKEETKASNNPPIFIHDASLFQELINSMEEPCEEEVKEEERTSPLYPRSKSNASVLSSNSEGITLVKRNSNNTTKKTELKELKTLQRETKRKEQEEYFEKVKLNGEKLRLKQEAAKEKKFFELWEEILRERSTFIVDLNKRLEAYEDADDRKKQQIYNEWCERVFDPIQSQIDDYLSSVPFEEIQKRKREKFDEYIRQLNHKQKNNGGVFRDIIIDEEYDPFELTRNSFKVSLKSNSPTSPSNGINEKASKLLEDKANKIPSRSLRKQDMLNVTQYDKLNATPYGHYNKMINPGSQTAKQATLKVKSEVALDDFSKEKRDPWENTKGKRITVTSNNNSVKTVKELVNGIDDQSKRKVESKKIITMIPSKKREDKFVEMYSHKKNSGK